MKWYEYVICFALIIAGLFSMIALVDIFDVHSKEYGSAIILETKIDYDDISKFDLTIDLDTTDYVNYSCIIVKDPIEFDGKNKDYLLLFNNQPANNMVVTNGKVCGDFTISFYDLEGVKVSTAKLDVIVEYYTSQIKITITTKNENDSIAYLATYMDINGAVLRVAERG